MALTNYGELKTAVATWLNRDDSVTAAVIPDFILLGTTRINRDLAGVRERMQQDITLEYTSILSPVGGIDQLSIEGYGTIEMTTMDRLDYYANVLGTTTGRPVYGSFIPAVEGGGVLRVVPTPDASYTLNIVYLPVLPIFVDDTDTNDILTTHPDIYLYAALAESAPYLKDDDRIGMWEQKYTGGIAALKTQLEKRRYPGTPVVRPRRALGS